MACGSFKTRNTKPLRDPTNYQACLKLKTRTGKFLRRMQARPGSWRFTARITGGSLVSLDGQRHGSFPIDHGRGLAAPPENGDNAGQWQRRAPIAGTGGSCRLCRAYCDWTIDPTACVDSGCPNLYAYDDERAAASSAASSACSRPRSTSRCSSASARTTAAGSACCAPTAGRSRSAGRRSSVAYGDRLPPIGCVNPEFAEPVDGEPFRITARV